MPRDHGAGAGPLIAAIGFGATFMAIVMLAVEVGGRLPVARTAATLTSVFAVGQMLGPLVVAPVVGKSYATAFAIAAGIVAVSAVLAATASLRAIPAMPVSRAPRRTLSRSR